MKNNTNIHGLLTLLTHEEVKSLSGLVLRQSNLKYTHLTVLLSNKTGKVILHAQNSAIQGRHYSVHAEVAALEKLQSGIRGKRTDEKSIRKGISLLSIRICASGNLGMAKPCDACMRRINSEPRVTKVCWTNSEGDVEWGE